MSSLLSVPPALPSLIACVLGLCSLALGWHTLRTRAIPALLEPMVQLSSALAQALQPSNTRAAARTPDTVRIHGWAFIYAGTLGLIIAGGQLLRLLTA